MAAKLTTPFSNIELLRKTQKLIHLYRSSECLWNPQSPGYHSVSVKEDAWRRITRQMRCGLTPDQVKLQVLALRNYYSKECEAIRLSQLEGYKYVPRHSYFEDLLFLGNQQNENIRKSNTSFSMDQDFSVLEDVFIQDDSRTIKATYPPNYSEATFCYPSVSLSECPSNTKRDYTFYKMILEPEPPNEEHIQNYKERYTSGNDRWYPTSYCLQCKSEEADDPCAACERRNRCSNSISNSCLKPRSSCRAKTTNKKRSQEECQCGSQSQDMLRIRQHRSNSQCGCTTKRSPRAHQSGVFVDMSNWIGNEANNSVLPRDSWPGPRLCTQTRREWKPRYRKGIPDENRKCYSGSWKRNNDAMCQQLQEKLANQENKSGGCSDEGGSGHSRNCNCRRRSGMDQQNGMPSQKMSQGKSEPQSISNNPPNDPGQNTNNQPISDRYYNDNNQPNVQPNRCSIYGCQCMYCNRIVVPPQENYYPPEALDQNPASFNRRIPPGNQVGQVQPYREIEYFNDFGRSGYPEQQHVYCINAENADMWVQAQATDTAANPAQMPMAPLSTSWQEEKKGASSQPGDESNPLTPISIPQQDQNNMYSSNANARSHPEQALSTKSNLNSPPQNILFVECPAYKNKPRTKDQKYQSNRGNYQNQEPDYDTDEETSNYVDRAAQRKNRNDHQRSRPEDENRSRRRPNKQDSDRPTQLKQNCDDVRCPANRSDRKDQASQRRNRTDERVASNPDSNYEDSPLPRRRNDDTETPNDQKVFQLRTDDSELIECPAFSDTNPQECPNLKYRREEPSCQDGEERIAQRKRPPSRTRDYEEEPKSSPKRRQEQDRYTNKRYTGQDGEDNSKRSPRNRNFEEKATPSSRGKSQGKSRNRPENETYEETNPNPRDRYSGQGREDNLRSKTKPADESNKPQRRNGEYCTDETCPFSSSRQDLNRSGRQPKNMREVEDPRYGYGENQNSGRKDFGCNDDTCPYADTGKAKEMPRKRRDQTNPKEQGEEANGARRRYRDESSPRRQLRDGDKAQNQGKGRREVGNYRNQRKEVPAEMDDYEYEPNSRGYESKRYKNTNSDSDKDLEVRSPVDEFNKYPRSEERNQPRRYDERQRDYRSENQYRSNRNAEESDCLCDEDMDSEGYDAYNGYPVMDKREYNRTEKSRRPKQPLSYDNSESEEREYHKSDNKRDKKPTYSRGTDVYCRCSADDFPKTNDRNMNSTQNRSTRKPRNDQRTTDNMRDGKKERTRGVEEEVVDCECKFDDANAYQKYVAEPETSIPNRGRRDKQDLDDPGIDNGNEIVICECEPDEDYNSKFENRNTNQNGNGNIVPDEGCFCELKNDPNEPKITVPKKRNQAGSICTALNLEKPQDETKKPKPLELLNSLKLERKINKAKTGLISDNQLPPVKKRPRPKTGISPRVQSRSASPVRLSGAQRAQLEEPMKQRTTTKTGGQSSEYGSRPTQSAAKRTMDTKAAVNRPR
ncbi:uncharacterized protein LOC108113344 isoform X2 [Drosophila eugracilis]|uniref:uncharacterized protein LOC108113344 isoform X2 n=1 Tax=Drosophila eugracilis TaxID=29029 RepID=UPI0007E7CAE8|nr:uncharacterized protein LOC108113344 isoform X2 [Drosophila eugracilis]